MFGAYFGFQCEAFAVSQCSFHYIMMFSYKQTCAENAYMHIYVCVCMYIYKDIKSFNAFYQNIDDIFSFDGAKFSVFR